MNNSAPGPQEKRFAVYREGLAKAAGHQERHTPFKDYCNGLPWPGERKSREPMAARVNPHTVPATPPPLHHLAAKAGVTGDAEVGSGAGLDRRGHRVSDEE